jgi:hypothetical protein
MSRVLRNSYRFSWLGILDLARKHLYPKKETMNQALLFDFSLEKNGRVYQFLIQGGAPWEEVDEVLDQLKKEFVVLRAEVVAREEAKAKEPIEAKVE